MFLKKYKLILVYSILMSVHMQHLQLWRAAKVQDWGAWGEMEALSINTFQRNKNMCWKFLNILAYK